MNKKLKIVFMGTPEFAVPSLKILLDHGYDIVGVITSTDKMGGRGKKQLLQSAVKKFAVANNLRVLQPPRLKRKDFIEELRSLEADLQVVVAFRMLPEVVWNMPRLGSINLHGSLLPRYRGAAPINWAVINGDKETGLTTFKLKHQIDTGDLIHQASVPIDENDTAGTLHDKMMPVGAELVLKTVQDIEAGNVIETPQDDSQCSHAPKIFHSDCEIDFTQPAQIVYNFIRGMSPYPCAWTTVDGKQLNIIKASLTDRELPIGEFDLSERGIWYIGCADYAIKLEEVQLSGKKRMKTRDLLNGYQPSNNAVG